GESDQVVHFRNRRQALADFARGVARGELRRAWAWRQLGLTATEITDSTAARALAEALAKEPRAIVPVLADLGLELRKLAPRFDPAWWPELAQRALASAGLPA